MQTKLTGPPIADNWQFFTVADYADAHPPEGYVQRSRLSAGVEWRIPNLTATFYPSQSWGTLTKPGAGATLDWSATDQIKLAFSSELYSWDTPLRALLQGITADDYYDQGNLSLGKRSSSSVSGSFAYLPFTDGNQRFSAGVINTEKLIALPGFDLTGIGEVNASHNNRPAAPYFNPDQDLTIDGGLIAANTIWRRRQYNQCLPRVSSAADPRLRRKFHPTCIGIDEVQRPFAHRANLLFLDWINPQNTDANPHEIGVAMFRPCCVGKKGNTDRDKKCRCSGNKCGDWNPNRRS